MKQQILVCGAVLAAACSATVHAADWSDTSLSYRYGSHFAEPYNPNLISKHIVNVSSASGYAYGTNFVSIDILMSDANDPSTARAKDGAMEAYAVYRNTLDLGKVSGRAFEFGPVRGLGLTGGFDLNTKNDAGYNSKKRMLVAGPTLMMDVPGFLSVSLLALWESNAPESTYTGVATPRYSYKVHPMVNLSWGVPFSLGAASMSFDGYANFIASKGKNEFGGDTARETNIDMQLMVDLSYALGMRNNTLRAGLEYQYWQNKFGNDRNGYAGPGAFAKTPMLRLEYHF